MATALDGRTDMVLAIKIYMLEIRCVLTPPKWPRAFLAPPRELAGETSFL